MNKKVLINHCISIVIVFFTSYFAVNMSYAKTMEDVKVLKKINGILSANLDGVSASQIKNQIEPLVTDALIRQVRFLLNRDKLYEFIDNPKLNELITRRSKVITENIYTNRSLSPQHVKSLSQATAHEMIDQWIGVSANQELNAELNRFMPKKRHLHDLGVTLSGTWKGATVVLSESYITSDEGGVSQDKKPNPGELLTLKLKIQNLSKRRLFSSSIWIKPKHHCLWVHNNLERVLPELNAFNSDGNHTEIELIVFSSHDCPVNQELPVSLILSDTFRNSGKLQTLEMNLKLSAADPLEVLQHNVDRDLPGHSDGETFKGIEKGAKVELSSVIQGSPHSRELITSYELSTQLKKLMSLVTPIQAPMISGGKVKGRFWPNDDLDLSVSTQTKDVDRLLKSLWKELGINHKQEIAPVLVALDVLVKKEELNDSQNDNKVDSQSDTKKEDLNSQPNVVEPLQSNELISMMKEYISIAPLPAIPKDVTQRSAGNGDQDTDQQPIKLTAIQAVNGYQVVFDEQGFTKDYEEQMRPQLTQKKQEQAENKLLNTVPQTSPISYQLQRFYLKLPAKVSKVEKKIKPKSKPVQPRPRPVAQVTQPMSNPRFSLKLGGGLADIELYSTDNTSIYNAMLGYRLGDIWLHLGYRNMNSYTSASENNRLTQDMSELVVNGSYQLNQWGSIYLKALVEFTILYGDFQSSRNGDKVIWNQTNYMLGGAADIGYALSPNINLGLNFGYSFGIAKVINPEAQSYLLKNGPLQQASIIGKNSIYFEYLF